MNKLHLSRAEINWRLWLSVGLAVLGYLSTNEWFASHVAPWVMVCVGCFNAALLAIRLFIDKSTSQGEPELQEPIPVMTPEGQPLKTEEVKPDVAN